MAGNSFTVITAFLTAWVKVPADWPFKAQVQTRFLKTPAGITGTAHVSGLQKPKAGSDIQPVQPVSAAKSGIKL